MSHILDDIKDRFPSFSTSLTSLPADEASDMRLMGELASHSVNLYEIGNVQDVSQAFELAERFLGSPLREERDAAVLGFLETIQNVASHRACGIIAFEQFLAPRSQVAWTELMEAWRGKNDLAEVLAAETGSILRPRWWQFWRKRHRNNSSDLLKDVQNPELRKIIEQITRE